MKKYIILLLCSLTYGFAYSQTASKATASKTIASKKSDFIKIVKTPYVKSNNSDKDGYFQVPAKNDGHASILTYYKPGISPDGHPIEVALLKPGGEFEIIGTLNPGERIFSLSRYDRFLKGHQLAFKSEDEDGRQILKHIINLESANQNFNYASVNISKCPSNKNLLLPVSIIANAPITPFITFINQTDKKVRSEIWRDGPFLFSQDIEPGKSVSYVPRIPAPGTVSSAEFKTLPERKYMHYCRLTEKLRKVDSNGNPYYRHLQLTLTPNPENKTKTIATLVMFAGDSLINNGQSIRCPELPN